MNINQYLVTFSDSQGNERGVDVELIENFNDEDVAKSIWPLIKKEVKDRLLPTSNPESTTPWQDQINGYGYTVISCTAIG